MAAFCKTVSKPQVWSAEAKAERMFSGTFSRDEWACMWAPIATDDMAAALPHDPSPRDMERMFSGCDLFLSTRAFVK